MALPALLAACGFNSGSSSDDGGHGSDSRDTRVCYGNLPEICFPAAPTAAQALTTSDIDTDSAAACESTNEQKARYCVLVGAPLTLATGQKLSAHGSKPLVLLSVGPGTMDISGEIDVSSRRTGTQVLGAGANPTETDACTFIAAATVGGGGFGGSFGSMGGNGSDASPVLGTKGMAGAMADGVPTTLRGGCPGGNGAFGGTGAEGHGGNGGGAVAIVAVEAQIHLDAKINASGSGGHGAPGGATGAIGGGGGGGSGGMIAILSPLPLSLGTHVKLWANGGGGAQGGAISVAGSDGDESAGPMQIGAGADGTGAAGNGGNGSLGSAAGLSGRAATNGGGGGGGGGGAGFIRAPGLTDPASISPPSS